MASNESVTFYVGDQHQPIVGRRSILSLASPVFAAILATSHDDNFDQLMFHFDRADTFALLVELASPAADIALNLEEAIRVCLMAHKYKMTDLVNKCLDYMQLAFPGRCTDSFKECMRMVEDAIETIYDFNRRMGLLIVASDEELVTVL